MHSATAKPSGNLDEGPRRSRRTLTACMVLSVALVISVSLQHPASSVGLRWAPSPSKRTLRMIELKPHEMIGALSEIRGEDNWVRWVAWGIAVLALLALLWAARGSVATRQRLLRSSRPAFSTGHAAPLRQSPNCLHCIRAYDSATTNPHRRTLSQQGARSQYW